VGEDVVIVTVRKIDIRGGDLGRLIEGKELGGMGWDGMG
tara:strand:- start:6309 stop:6425 length:117 start_codon:yes stop_codon:yes gene_type:complete